MRFILYRRFLGLILVLLWCAPQIWAQPNIAVKPFPRQPSKDALKWADAQL